MAKYVPVEIVAAYLAAQSYFVGTGPPTSGTLQILVYLGFVAMTIAYLRKVGGNVPRKTPQIVIGTIAFVVWTYSIGGSFFWPVVEARFGIALVPFLQLVLVVFWTLGAGLYRPTE